MEDKILQRLQEEAGKGKDRQPVAKLAEELGVTAPKLRYQIKKYVKQGKLDATWTKKQAKKEDGKLFTIEAGLITCRVQCETGTKVERVRIEDDGLTIIIKRA